MASLQGTGQVCCPGSSDGTPLQEGTGRCQARGQQVSESGERASHNHTAEPQHAARRQGRPAATCRHDRQAGPVQGGQLVLHTRALMYTQHVPFALQQCMCSHGPKLSMYMHLYTSHGAPKPRSPCEHPGTTALCLPGPRAPQVEALMPPTPFLVPKRTCPRTFVAARMGRGQSGPSRRLSSEGRSM